MSRPETSLRWVALYILVVWLIVSHLLLRQDLVQMNERLPAAIEGFHKSSSKGRAVRISRDRNTTATALKESAESEKRVAAQLRDATISSRQARVVGTAPKSLSAEEKASDTDPSTLQKQHPTATANAYAFLLGGCDPDQGAYRYFLYGVYVAVHTLKKTGSKADFHVFIEMLHDSPHMKLPTEEGRVIQELGAVVHYIPTYPDQSFYRTQLQKFRILGLTQYNHICYLDADILPLSNFDYMFDLIDQGILRKNVAFVSKVEPVNGGSFVLTPRPGALQEINNLISKKEHSEWDTVTGWGHEIKEPDRYLTGVKGAGRTWDFFGADGDQGLLFYWAKYVEQDVSFILTGGKIEHWGPGKDGQFRLLESTKKAFRDLDLPESFCPEGARMCYGQHRPRRDLFHFTGDRKPWVLGLPEDYCAETYRSTVDHYWFSLLDEINQKHHLGLNLKEEFGKKEYADVTKTIGYNLKFNQNLESQWFTTIIDHANDNHRVKPEPVTPDEATSAIQLNNQKHAKNAYSFLIGGCDPDRPGKYRYFLYSIYVIISILKQAGSTADFHVFVEMFYDSKHDKLLDLEERVLLEVGAEVHYIPKRPGQSFYGLQLQKFRILGLTQYKHVMYLDSDVVPLTNLDYLFDLVDQGILRKNVAFVGKSEPANGGTFILSPRTGALREISDIIFRKEHASWDKRVGWGQEIVAPDRYLTNIHGERRTWRFHGSDTDQGLLYYWIKYVEKDASFILGNGTVDHWGQDSNGKIANVGFQTLTVAFPEYITPCTNAGWCATGPRPRADYIHLTGSGKYERKPWFKGMPDDYSIENMSSSVVHLWFSVLDEVNQKHRMGLDLKKAFGSKVPRNATILEGYNDAFKQIRVSSYSTIID